MLWHQEKQENGPQTKNGLVGQWTNWTGGELISGIHFILAGKWTPWYPRRVFLGDPQLNLVCLLSHAA